MSARWRRLGLTYIAGAALLAIALAVAGLLVWDVLLVLFVPFFVLGLTDVRLALHWTLFALIATATIVTLVRIETSDSSTAGFGLIIVPLLLIVAVLLAALFDRILRASARGVG